MVRRIGPVVAVVAGFALAVASPAAAVVVGQLAPGSPPDASCTNGPNDSLTPTVTSGNSYVIPDLTAPYGMTVTSWSTNAAAGDGQMLTFKVFRKTGEPATYQAVGHDGPRPLTPSVINTFPTSIPVHAGDVIGLNDENAISVPNACDFFVSGETSLYYIGSLADGGSPGDFSEFTDYLHNITAEVSANAAPTPSTLKKKRCKKKKKHKSGAVIAKKKCKKKHRRSAF
jgi:hypothetical protein